MNRQSNDSSLCSTKTHDEEWKRFLLSAKPAISPNRDSAYKHWSNFWIWMIKKCLFVLFLHYDTIWKNTNKKKGTYIMEINSNPLSKRYFLWSYSSILKYTLYLKLKSESWSFNLILDIGIARTMIAKLVNSFRMYFNNYLCLCVIWKKYLRDMLLKLKKKTKIRNCIRFLKYCLK